jgi:fucose permease
MSMTGSILPDISSVFSLSRSALSSIPSAQFLGGFTALVFIGFVFPLVKPKIILLCAASKLTLALVLISVLRTYSFAVLVAFFCVGTSMSVIFVIPGVITSCAKDTRGAESMNILYSFMSAGVVVSPVVSGLLFGKGSHYPAVAMVIAAAALLSAVITAFAGFPDISLGKGLSLQVIKDLAGKHSRFFIVVLVMSLCYMGSEAVPNNWIPKYLTDSFPGFSDFRSRLVLSLFWAFITSGRYICAFTLRFWRRPVTLLVLLAVAAAACISLAPLMKQRAAAEWLFMLSGLFFSGMMPIILAFTQKLEAALSGSMFVLILTVGMLGASVVSKAVGMTADRAGFSTAIVLGAVPLVIIVLLSAVGSEKL